MASKNVKKHYENISDDYYSKSNKYCERRYEEIVRKASKGKKAVLEIGCGNAAMAAQMKARYVGVDLSEGMLKNNKNLKKGDQLLCADASDLPFEEGMFDLIYSINLLEHVKKPDKVIKEATRVLKPNGTLLMITPNGNLGWILEIAEILKLKLPEGPHRFLKRDELKRTIRKNGLKIKKFKEFVTLPFGPYRIAKKLEFMSSFNLGLFHLVIAKKK